MTTGAGNDIEKATELARKMVCEWGMSEKLGPLTFGKKEEHVFLGREIAQRQNFSEKVAEEIDLEIKKFVVDNYQRAKRLVEDNIDALHRLAKALLEKEVLDSSEIDRIIFGEDTAGVPATKTPPETEKIQAEKVDPDTRAEDAGTDDTTQIGAALK